MDSAPPATPLAEGEVVFRSAPVRITASPGAFGGLRGVAVLTSERLVVVPGTALARVRRGDPLQRALGALWEAVRPALLDAFPIARIVSERRTRSAQLAARARPGIEIPLEMVRRSFEARLPGWLGVELALPSPDPRPPFALYLELDPSGGAPREWSELMQAQKHRAPFHPELERPYALFYLLAPLPRPAVRISSRQGTRRGTLTLHADGPAIASAFGETVLLPYESITRLVLADTTPWRRASLRIEAGEHAMVIRPRNDWDAAQLHDTAHLIAELAAIPLRRDAGSVRVGRVLTAVATVAGAAAAVAWEIARSLP